MRTVTYSLVQLLNEAKRQVFVIPRFQRNFVWNQSQVKLLIDSVARNYPIGSLLLLQESDPTKPFLASRPIDARFSHFSDEDQSDTETTEFISPTPVGAYYVLDGQQRLTSLIRVLLQASESYRYFFDLNVMHEIDTLDRNPSSWIIKRSCNRSQSQLRYLPSEIAIDKSQCSIRIQQYFMEEGLRDKPTKERIEGAAKVCGYFETIRNFQVPLVIIDRTDSTEAICRIFETINSTGTRLTTFDLAVARYFPKPDLQSIWADTQEQYPILKHFEAEGEKLLQVIAYLESHEKNNIFEVTRGALLAIDRSSIEKFSKKAAHAMSMAYSWIEGHGAVKGIVPNESILVPLAFFFAIIDDRWKQYHQSFSHVLARWYFANSIQQGAYKATNYRIAVAINQLRSWFLNSNEPEIPEVTLRVSDVISLSKTDNRYRALHALMRWQSPNDLWTDEKLSFDDVEDHHIYPAVCIKRHQLPKKKIDSIANRILVSSSTNRNLSDRMPNDYLTKLVADAQQPSKGIHKLNMLKKACIPMNCDYSVESCEKFLEERAKLLVDMCQQLLGDRFRSNEATANKFDNDDSEDMD